MYLRKRFPDRIHAYPAKWRPVAKSAVFRRCDKEVLWESGEGHRSGITF